MPRNYQRTKNNPYLLPHNLYMRVLYIIKDYDRMKDEYRDVLDSSPSPSIETGLDAWGNTVAEFGARRAEPSNPTEAKALRLALMSDEMHAIEQALMTVPREYRKGVLDAIKYRAPYPDIAGYKTWQRWRQRYIWHVAKILKFI